MKQQTLVDDGGYILRSGEAADNRYQVATDTFVVRDGKIVAQPLTGRMTPGNGRYIRLPEAVSGGPASPLTARDIPGLRP